MSVKFLNNLPIFVSMSFMTAFLCKVINSLNKKSFTMPLNKGFISGWLIVFYLTDSFLNLNFFQLTFTLFFMLIQKLRCINVFLIIKCFTSVTINVFCKIGFWKIDNNLKLISKLVYFYTYKPLWILFDFYDVCLLEKPVEKVDDFLSLPFTFISQYNALHFFCHIQISISIPHN